MPDDPWTIGRLLAWTKDFLAQHGSTSARLDAEVLLAHARNCERIELYTAYDEVASNELRDSFRALVKDRAAGTPVAYLVGHREFYSLSFRVTKDVLIPRPETEFLVIRLRELAKEHFANQPISLVDVGTGSGILATCAARYLPPGSEITAVDISPAALEVAEANAEHHDVAGKISFMPSDLLSDLPPDQTFNMIVSNPPYVSEPEFAELDPQVRDFEPKTALVAGPKGTEVVDRLIEQAAERLTPGGWLIVEISPMIREAVEQRLLDSAAFQDVRVTEDLAKLPRIVEAQRAGTGHDGPGQD